MPLRIRSAIRLRSSSATAASTVNISLPYGVEVSMFSVRLTKSMFSDFGMSQAK
jgi:hypothetical protein